MSMQILTTLQQALDWSAGVMTALWWFEIGLMVAGALVAWMCLMRWRRSGWRDPLAGSPIRLNRLTPLTLWLAVLTYMLVGPTLHGLALWLSPSAESAADMNVGLLLIVNSMSQMILAAVWLVIIHQTFRGGWRGLFVGPWRSDRDLRWSFPAFLVALCVCSLVSYATVWIVYLLRPEYQLPDHTILTAMREASTPLWLQFIALFSAGVLAPVSEELFFRGICQTGIKKLLPPRWGSMYHRWAAIGIVAFLFGLGHISVFHHVPALMVLGVLLGYCYERTGSLMVPILIHMFFNCKTLVHTLIAQAVT